VSAKTFEQMLADLPPIIEPGGAASNANRYEAMKARMLLLRRLVLEAEPHIYGNDSEQWLVKSDKVLEVTRG
jgi:hypothetical protein